MGGLFLLLVTLICSGLFRLGYMMTTSPGSSSGNGNPALLLLFLLLPLLILLIFLWVRVIRKYRVKSSFLILTIVVIPFHWVSAIFYQLREYDKYVQIIAEAYKERFGYTDWTYISHITSGFSIHINNQFFNLNTFLVFCTLAIFVAASYVLLRKRIRFR